MSFSAAAKSGKKNEKPEASGVKRKRMSIIEYMKRKKVSLSDETDPQKKLSEESGNGLNRSVNMEFLASDAERCMESQKELAVTSTELSSEVLDGSQSLFSDSSSSTDEICAASAPPSILIPDHFNRSPVCLKILPALVPDSYHSVLFRPHLLSGTPPRPFPDKYRDYWDKSHVRMPCSPENLYPTLDKKIQKRWELIEGTLLQPFATSKDLEEAVLTYNHHYKDKWNFESWHSYCNIDLNDSEREDLLTNLLPNMVNLALQLPTIVTQAPVLLRTGEHRSVTFSQKQIACLLANAFFCTYPRRNSLKSSEFSTFPDINFSKLFRGTKDVVNHVKNQKYKALLHYFRRVLNDMPSGTVTYSRQVLTGPHPNWESCDKELCNLYVSPEGTIEDNGEGFLQVDFANRMIGGGVVGEGCVQEEIRFLICPELILSRLFTEKLEPNESLVITGAERFSTYSGYAQTFKWTGDYVDFTPRDRWGRRCTEIVAIDAHVFHCYADQFKAVSLKRELDKAYVGFRSATVHARENLQAVATGNWGCGAFGGSIHVKALLQIMASTLAMRNVVYFTFADHKFAAELRQMHDFLIANSVTIGHLYQLLVHYGKDIQASQCHISLYPYLLDAVKRLGGKLVNEKVEHLEEDALVMRGVPGEIPDDMAPLSPEYAADTP